MCSSLFHFHSIGNVAEATAAEEAPVATTVAPGQQQEHSQSRSQSEVLQLHINQNLIMSQPLEVASFADASAAALTAPEQRATSLSSSSSSQGTSSGSGSGSSITSFDSNNLIDDKRLPQQPQQEQLHHPQQQQHQQQQHQQHHQQQHSRIQAKDTAGPYPIPVHIENHLEPTHGIDGADNVFGTPMYFGTENSTVVTTQIGATAHVPCTVHHIGEGVVSKHATHSHTTHCQLYLCNTNDSINSATIFIP